MVNSKEPKAWIVTVDMGLGHQRAALPLASIAAGGSIITANNYEGIPAAEFSSWRVAERWYLFISRLSSRGPLGRLIFAIFDYFQRIQDYYPRKKNVKPPWQLKSTYAQIRAGLGRDLIKKLNSNPVPLFGNFLTIGIMAEHWQYKGPVFILGTDSDLSRSWVPLDPQRSSLNYFAPSERAAERLEQYGVPKSKIFYSGFPLPDELVGEASEIAKKNLRARLTRLDPAGIYRKRYAALIASCLGDMPGTSSRAAVTILFAVGGAGAQAKIGAVLVRSLTPLIKTGEIKLILSAGISKSAAKIFERAVSYANIRGEAQAGVEIIFSQSKTEYFAKFNRALQETDILWTKPSELSFYAALGLPIIMSPPVGSQEIKNREWLLNLGAGVDQLDLRYAHEWLPDLLKNGKFAECAMEGFIKMEREGTRRIKEILFRAATRKTHP
ncbi:MAG: hypothetical protein Q8P97_02465 [bacterium]|nr:hypothetical protein [bacterium]